MPKGVSALNKCGLDTSCVLFLVVGVVVFVAVWCVWASRCVDVVGEEAGALRGGKAEAGQRRWTGKRQVRRHPVLLLVLGHWVCPALS